MPAAPTQFRRAKGAYVTIRRVAVGAHARIPPALRQMNALARIAIDPQVRFGKPCVRGTRLTVVDVLSYLAAGRTEEELLTEYPQLEHRDVLACLAFAAERERRLRVIPTS